MYLEEIKNYWDMRADGYAKKNEDELNSFAAEEWTDRLLKYMPTGKALNCLDMGCGPGFLGVLLAKLGHNVTFADYSENMLLKARNNVENAGVFGTFQQTDAQNPAFEDNTFDVIVNRNLVWNLEKPGQTYDQWLRILKPRGRLIIFDGNHYLYYFDQAYVEERKCRHFKDPHTKVYMQGVNSKIIDDIALNLPLSACQRPNWDMDFFLKRRIKHIQIEAAWKDFIGIDNTKKSIIKTFTICVEK